MKRLLVIDLQDPEYSEYMYPEEYAIFILGRQLSHYPVFLVNWENLKMEPIYFPSSEFTDIKNLLMELVK
jgi:hypothetical protein